MGGNGAAGVGRVESSHAEPLAKLAQHGVAEKAGALSACHGLSPPPPLYHGRAWAHNATTSSIDKKATTLYLGTGWHSPIKSAKSLFLGLPCP
jgi:hypothetical protein